MSPNRWLSQCCRSRAVSGVTFQESESGSSRHRIHALPNAADECGQVVLLRLGADGPRGPVEDHFALARALFFGFGIRVMTATLRRSSQILFVGWPLRSSSQWRHGYSYGEFRIGCSKNVGSILRQAKILVAHPPSVPLPGLTRFLLPCTPNPAHSAVARYTCSRSHARKPADSPVAVPDCLQPPLHSTTTP